MECNGRPKWLLDYPDIEHCLHVFLDKLDNRPTKEWAKPPRISINKVLFSSLLDDSDEMVWTLLNALDEELEVIKIHPYKKLNSYDPPYKKARIEFRFKAEETVRIWLNRPYQQSGIKKWQSVVDLYTGEFPGTVSRLRSRPLKVQSKSAESILEALIRMKDYQQKGLSLRQLSARCFWGLSKVLDSQEELILSLYPNISLKQRPLIVNIHLPSQVQGCLFIENYDTYVNALQGDIPEVKNMILVYCSGFKNSAKRIRDKTGADLHWSGVNLNNKKSLINWWFSKTRYEHSVYFWGDLDYSGMGILSSLKDRFPEIQAWETGYLPMIDYLNKGIAHSPDMAKKENQVDPVETGCHFADTQILPAIRRYGLFVDQEIIF